MIDYKMIVNIALGIVLAMIIVALGSALVHKAGFGGKERGMYGANKAMVDDTAEVDDTIKIKVQ